VWLDRSFPHHDITQLESSLYLKNAVSTLMTARGFTLEELAANRFRLRDAVVQKIGSLRKQMAKAEYERLLLPGCETPIEVSPEKCFTYPLPEYPAQKFYDGSPPFPKHYYEKPADMNSEEVACAVVIDTLPEVEFWVRNLERDPRVAFWLQTPTDKFYPDFVAKLKDGRFLVVEYKGEQFKTTEDTLEKDSIGQLWEARSNGLCLFRLVTKETMQQKIHEAVGG